MKKYITKITKTIHSQGHLTQKQHYQSRKVEMCRTSESDRLKLS